MATYESYKDSGVKWLGQIPSHWKVKKLRAFFDRRNHKVSDTEFAPLSVTKNGIVPQMENVAKSKDSENRRLVKVGDFVINSRSDRKGSSGVSSLEGSVSFVNTIMTPRVGIIPTFCNYLLKSYAFIEENYRNGHGIVADLWTTSFDEQKLIKLAMPPADEQTAIVEYLDMATAEIDRAIEAQQKMIEALNERKQIIITRAVSKGLNPDTPLRDSGIDWLGKIPAHWDSTSFRRYISVLTDYTSNGSFADLAANVNYLDEPNYSRLIRLTDLRQNLENKGVWIDKHSHDFLKNSELFGGELLMACVGAYAGLPWIMPKLDFRASLAPNMFLIKTKSSLLHDFAKNFFIAIFDKIQTIAVSAAQPKLNKQDIRSLPILVPPLEEQIMILSYINDKTSSIDEAITDCERMISLLQERKQIIINEVVTGKKKVI